MTQVSIFIGGVRPLPESGRPTGMYKQAVQAPVDLGPEGFAGDVQADRRVHGGLEKAVHLYPASHYARLAERFPDARALLVPGALGENLSCAGLDETGVRIGDIWKLGSARIQVCQPRNPCWKIDERCGQEGMAQYIAEHLLTGWYWRVLKSGRVTPGDALLLEEASPGAPTLRDAQLLWASHRPPLVELERLAGLRGLGVAWRDKIEQRLGWLRKNRPQG